MGFIRGHRPRLQLQQRRLGRSLALPHERILYFAASQRAACLAQ